MTRLEIIRLKLNAANELVRELVAEHNDLMMRELEEVPKDCPIQILVDSANAMIVAMNLAMEKEQSADVRNEPVLKTATNQQEFNEKYLFRTKVKAPLDVPPYTEKSFGNVRYSDELAKKAQADSLNIHTQIANLETRVRALEDGKKLG